jgi:curved DNA-binding protein CbpA
MKSNQDPWAVLGLRPGTDDAAIRARYLELVREYTPEQHPERFSAIRDAYQSLRSIDVRVQARLFPDPRSADIDQIIQEAACLSPRGRIPIDSIFAATFPKVSSR